MDSSGLIVVGSGPAGVSAAEAFREHDTESPVTILTDDPALPYERPPLSKEYLRGEAEQSDAQLHDADWFADKSIEIVHTEPVDTIDTESRVVTVGDKRYPYRALVFAAGARPAPIPVPGGEHALLLRSLENASVLRSAAEGAASAVVIGAGFIGCEAAASLAMRGITATLVAPSPVPQAKRLGDDAGRRILDMLRGHDVSYVGGVKVASINPGIVHFDNGDSIEADLILAATGVQPQAGPATTAGITSDGGRIVVDASMRSSVDGVFAAGDVAMALNAGAGRRIAVEHWQDAMDQGEVAGTVAAGGEAKWEGVPGFWSTIGESTLKYHAWGDGFADATLVEHDGGDRAGFTVWYSDGEGACVGVLTHNSDDDYDRGEELILRRQPPPA